MRSWIYIGWLIWIDFGADGWMDGCIWFMMVIMNGIGYGM